MNINDCTYNELKPFGELSIIAMKGCEEIASRIDYYLKEWRRDQSASPDGSDQISTYLLDAVCPRFGSGEAKGVLNETDRKSVV